MSTSSVYQVASPSRYETHFCFEFIFEEAPLPVVVVGEIDHGAELREGHAGGGVSVDVVQEVA